MQCPEAWQTGTCCTVWLQPVDCGTMSPPQSKLGAEVGSKAFGEKEETKTFLYVHLLNKNSFMTIQYSLVISVEKIISLYIQKYRFEHYENNHKYHEKLVLQRRKWGG